MQADESRRVASIYLSQTPAPQTSKLNLYQQHKGYALKANLDHDAQAERKGDFVIARNKDYRWFAGLNWRFQF